MKKMEEEGKLRTEEMKKWTEGVVAGIYKAVLPTDSPTEIKNNIILNYSVGEVSKIRW
jgi:predicted ATP-grasp superfamily ATP-dependent carboligase